MKVKLVFLPRYHINPDTEEEDTGLAKFPPLGVSVVSSYLKQNDISVDLDDLDAKVIDFNQNNSNIKINTNYFADNKRIEDFIKTGHDPVLEREGEKILALTDCKGYDIWGFSLNIPDNPSTIGIALVLGKLLKEKYGVKIVVGGGFGDDITKKLLKGDHIDFVIHGGPVTSIAEKNMLNFCRGYQKGKELKNIPGVIYLKNGELVYTKQEHKYSHKEKFMINKPDFSGLPIDCYKRKFRVNLDGEELQKEIIFLPYFFVRGCPNRCSFCTYAPSGWTSKDPEKVVNELSNISKKFNIDNFFFLNTELNCSYEYAENLANEIIKKELNINWTDCATFERIDTNLLSKLKEAGAIRLVYGMESGNPKVLSMVKHPTFSHRQAENILKETYRRDIFSQIDVILGFPYEGEYDIDCTINFINKNSKYLTGGVNLNKFYLNGPMIRNPENFSIKKLDKEKLKRNWSTEAFNEKYGMVWENKVKETTRLYNKVHKSMSPADSFVPSAHELFFIANTPKLRNVFFENKNPPEIIEIT